MTQDNIDLIKAVFRAWDESGVEGIVEFFHDDIEYFPMEEGDVIRGHDAMRRYYERWLEAWEEFEIGPTEFLATGDRVFNGIELEGRGRGSGVEVAMEYWQVWLIRDGKAARWEEFLDRGEALKAAGLSPRR